MTSQWYMYVPLYTYPMARTTTAFYSRCHRGAQAARSISDGHLRRRMAGAATLTTAATLLAPHPCSAFHYGLSLVPASTVFNRNPPFAHLSFEDQLEGFTTLSRRYLASKSTSLGSSKQTENERQMTDDALRIVAKAIESVNPSTAIQSSLSATDDKAKVLAVADPTSKREIRYKREDYDEVVVVSFGKASSAMALATAEIASRAWPGVDMCGIAIVKDGHATEEESQMLPGVFNIEVFEASHPIPDLRSVSATQKVLELLKTKASERTLVLCCISGGGSALLTCPRPPLTLEDIAETNSCLLRSGISIDKMNIVRKRLDDAKGGKLGIAAYPSAVASLILSDVVGDPLDLIASGPTVPDSSNWQDASDLLGEFGLGRGGRYQLPTKVLDLIEQGLRGEIEDTPGGDHLAFATKGITTNVLVGNNERAVLSAAREAECLGYNPIVLGCTVEGEAGDVAGVYVSIAEQLIKQQQSLGSSQAYGLAKLPAAVVAGGETTVTLDPSSSGKGGRNQEIGLVAALNLRAKGIRDVVVASVGTDGTDGPTDAAGAVVDGGTIDRIEGGTDGEEEHLSGKEALAGHDAYSFLDMDANGNSLIRTGPTGTNVADVCVTLVK